MSEERKTSSAVRGWALQNLVNPIALRTGIAIPTYAGGTCKTVQDLLFGRTTSLRQLVEARKHRQNGN